MSMTRSQLRDEIILNLGDFDDATAMASRVNTYISWTLEELGEMRNWKNMLRWDKNSMKTREGGLEYALPSDLKEPLKVSYQDESNSKELTYLDESAFDMLWPDPSSDGNSTPVYYTWRDEYIDLYPIPSESGKPLWLYGAFWPKLLVSDNDTSDMKRMDKVITAGATLLGYNSLNDDVQEIKWRTIFLRRLKRRARADGAPQRWTPRWGSIPASGSRRSSFFYVPAVGDSLVE